MKIFPPIFDFRSFPEIDNIDDAGALLLLWCGLQVG